MHHMDECFGPHLVIFEFRCFQTHKFKHWQQPHSLPLQTAVKDWVDLKSLTDSVVLSVCGISSLPDIPWWAVSGFIANCIIRTTKWQIMQSYGAMCWVPRCIMCKSPILTSAPQLSFMASVRSYAVCSICMQTLHPVQSQALDGVV